MLGFIALPAQTLDTYSEWVAQGYYYSPGFDCQLTSSKGEQVFSMTSGSAGTGDESAWSLFLMKKVNLNVSSSGYQVKNLLPKQVEGETLTCQSASPGADIFVFNRTYGGDMESPDNLSIVVSRNANGDLEAAACEWTYGPAEAVVLEERAFLNYRDKSGAKLSKPLGALGVCRSNESEGLAEPGKMQSP